MEAEGKEVQRDAFGHVKLDSINPGKYFADTVSAMIGAEKVRARPDGGRARARARPGACPSVRRASPHARMARARGVCTQVLVQEGRVLRHINIVLEGDVRENDHTRGVGELVGSWSLFSGHPTSHKVVGGTQVQTLIGWNPMSTQ